MSTSVGLWIDHRKAVVVTITNKQEAIEMVISKVEKQFRRSGDSPLNGSYESQQVPADDSRQRTVTSELNMYYDAVIVSLHTAEWLLIFGPGEAKHELNKRLEEQHLAGRVVGIETVDKMTDRQIAAKVRHHFAA